jgi:tight adherence protein B
MVSPALLCAAVASLCWPVARTATARLAALPPLRPEPAWRIPSRLKLRWLPVAGLLPLIPFVGPVGATSMGLLVAAGWRQRRVRQRAKAEIAAAAAMAEALRTMVAELRSGAPPALAAESAGSDAPPDVAGVMRTLAGSARFGGDVVLAPGKAPTRVHEQVAKACYLSRRHGLPLAELLDAVRRDIAASARFAERANASMSGPRASAAVLAALPGVGVLLGEAIGARPLHVLSGTSAGQLLLVLGAALILAGVAWSARLTRSGVAR